MMMEREEKEKRGIKLEKEKKEGREEVGRDDGVEKWGEEGKWE